MSDFGQPNCNQLIGFATQLKIEMSEFDSKYSSAEFNSGIEGGGRCGERVGRKEGDGDLGTWGGEGQYLWSDN